MNTMDPARQAEAQALERCLMVIRGQLLTAESFQEANVFRVAATLIRSRCERSAQLLRSASQAHFSLHPHTSALDTAEVIRRGWIMGLPRFGDMLIKKMSKVNP
jgi:hypothetical protein